MACGVSGIVLATWGAQTSSANCNSAKARRTTRTCCTPPFRRLRNSCWSFLVTSILRGGRPIPRVCAKTILHKNGFYELFQVVKDLVLLGSGIFFFAGLLIGLSRDLSIGRVVSLSPADDITIRCRRRATHQYSGVRRHYNRLYTTQALG